MAQKRLFCRLKNLLSPSLALLASWVCFILPVSAQNVRVLVQNSPLAGFQYHQAAAVWDQLRVGDALELQREPDNPHDVNAVRVFWRGALLGYLPKKENRSVAQEIDQGARVSGRISQLREDANPWRRLRIDVYLAL